MTDNSIVSSKKQRGRKPTVTEKYTKESEDKINEWKS